MSARMPPHPDPGARDIHAAYLASAVLAAVIAGFAAMIPLGIWKNDEYWILGAMHRTGLAYLRWGALWSPRPLWHLIFIGYGQLVSAASRPLIAPMLAWLWLLAPAAWWLALGRRRRDAWAWLLFLALFGAALTGTRVTEMFYWTAASLAYLPTFAALLAMLAILSLRGTTEQRDRVILACAGSVAALSSEFGQMVAAGFGILGSVTLVVRGRRPGPWLLIPAAIGCALAPVMLFFRIGRPELTLAGSPTLGRPLASLAHGLAQTAANVLPLASAYAPHHVTLFGVAVMTLLGIGSCALWRKLDARPDAGLLLAFCAALCGTSYAVSALAFYHFGWSCCERHVSMQHVSACVAVAAFAAIAARRVAVPAPLGAGSLLAAVLAPALCWWPLYRDALSSWADSARAKQLTWSSGSTPGRGEMVLTWCARCTLFRYEAYAVPGRWVLGRDTPWAQRSVMDFFAKAALVQRPDTELQAACPQSESPRNTD